MSTRKQAARAKQLSAAAFRAHITRCNLALAKIRNHAKRAAIVARRTELQSKLSRVAA